MKRGRVAERFELVLPRPLGIALILFPLLAAAVVSVAFVGRLPETVPVNLIVFRQADGAGSRFLFVASFPALQLVHLLARIASSDGSWRNHSRIRFGLLVGSVLLAVQAAWFGTQVGHPVSEAFLIPGFIGGLLVLGGFLMSGSKPNVLFGIRTSWTLGDPRIWEQTHNTAGPLTMVTGGLCVVFGILLSPSVALGATLGITLLSAGSQIYYSYVVAQKLRDQRPDVREGHEVPSAVRE